MKPITGQLIIAAFILALVTVASLGIRHVRFSAHRTRTVEKPVIAEAKAESDHYSADSTTVDAEPDPQYADASESYERAPLDDHAEAKSFKGDYAKSKGSKKGLEKISLGDDDNLYITEKGEYVYVGKLANGKIVKRQVQIDETTGEMTVVDRGDYAKSKGSQGLQKISMGDNENIYITEEGQTWYVTEGSKARVEIDDSTGEMTVIEQFGGDGGK